VFQLILQMSREVAATFPPHPALGMQQYISEESPPIARSATSQAIPHKQEEAMKPICQSMKLSIIAAPAAAITVVKAALFAGILMTFAPVVVLGQPIEKKDHSVRHAFHFSAADEH
jgi:hypothetical protein